MVNDEYSCEFITFVKLCLVHFTTSQNFRYKYYNTYTSNILTVIDEALEMLLLENKVDDYHRIISKKWKLTRKESKQKYKKSDKVNNKFCGYHKKCIKRYSELFQIVISSREISKSKELEIDLKLIYAKLCGKGKKNHDGDEGTHDISSDSEDDDIEGFDCFAWDLSIKNVTQIEAV